MEKKYTPSSARRLYKVVYILGRGGILLEAVNLAFIEIPSNFFSPFNLRNRIVGIDSLYFGTRLDRSCSLDRTRLDYFERSGFDRFKLSGRF